jgi:diacylglycerol kinase (ATP)
MAGVLAASRWRGVSQQIEIDGEPLSALHVLTLVGNARRYAGGLFHVSPGAVFDDGLLEVVIFQGRTFADALAGTWRLLRGQHRADPRTLIRPARQVVVTGPRIPAETDGERLAAPWPLAVAVAPRALRVLVPANAPPGLFQRPPVARLAP